MRGRMMMRGRRGELAAALKLTDAQRAKVADIRERQMRRGIQLRADLALARLDLRKLLRADKPSTTAIDAQIDRMARLRADLTKARIGSLLEMRALLTPEQQKILRERGGAWGERGMGERRMGGGFGAPGRDEDPEQQSQ